MISVDAVLRYAEPEHDLSAGGGAKGPRLYDWARVPLGWAAEPGFERWLLIRRSIRDRDRLTFFFAYAPQGHRIARARPSSPAPRAAAGPSRNAFCAPRTTSGSTIARRAPGMDGTAT